MGWLGDDDNDKKSLWSTYIPPLPPVVNERLQRMPWTTDHSVLLGVTAVTGLAVGYRMGRVGRSVFQRITSVHEISKTGPDTPWLRGQVLSVSDGDTFRFYHQPTVFHSATAGANDKVSEVALPVRVCTIDTPETAKFGKPGQPFGDNAKEYLSTMILNKTVHIQLLTKDQYGRVVAQVKLPRLFGFFPKYVDEQMLKAGLAEVYLGGGAVYGRKGKAFYLSLQEEAQQNKVGIWSVKDRESAASFKARMKEASQ